MPPPDHTYAIGCTSGDSHRTTEYDVTDTCMQTEGPHYVSTETQAAVKTASSSVQCNTLSANQGTQTDLSGVMIDQMINSNHEMIQKLGDKDSMKRELFVDSILSSDEKVRQYTGLPNRQAFDTLETVVDKCEAKLNYWQGPRTSNKPHHQQNKCRKPGPSRKLSRRDELLLALVRLRLGIMGFFLGDLFGVSTSRVSQIFITWMTYLAEIPKPTLLKWPSLRKVRKYMPMSFKRQDSNTRAKFERRKDSEDVLRAVKTGILNDTNLSVNEQFPAAISQRRQELLPKLCEERAKGNRAHINYDTLYINGVPWTPAPTPPTEPALGQANKRDLV